MRAQSGNRRKFSWLLAWVAALACGGEQGPYPSVTLQVRGQVLTADPAPVAVPRATVSLNHFQGFLGNPQVVARTTADHTGRYQLRHPFTSICEPSDQSGYWIEASAEGYETASTYNSDPTLPTWPSDPPIYCTNDPQVIDLSLHPFGSLQVITNTTGSGAGPGWLCPPRRRAARRRGDRIPYGTKR